MTFDPDKSTVQLRIGVRRRIDVYFSLAERARKKEQTLSKHFVEQLRGNDCAIITIVTKYEAI